MFPNALAILESKKLKAALKQPVSPEFWFDPVEQPDPLDWLSTLIKGLGRIYGSLSRTQAGSPTALLTISNPTDEEPVDFRQLDQVSRLGCWWSIG